MGAPELGPQQHQYQHQQQLLVQSAAIPGSLPRWQRELEPCTRASQGCRLSRSWRSATNTGPTNPANSRVAPELSRQEPRCHRPDRVAPRRLERPAHATPAPTAGQAARASRGAVRDAGRDRRPRPSPGTADRAVRRPGHPAASTGPSTGPTHPRVLRSGQPTARPSETVARGPRRSPPDVASAGHASRTDVPDAIAPAGAGGIAARTIEPADDERALAVGRTCPRQRRRAPAGHATPHAR